MMLYLRYINPIYYVTLCEKVISYNINCQDSVKNLIKDPGLVIEYPLLSLALAKRFHPHELEDVKELYRFSLSYQNFLLHRRKILSSSSNGPKCSISDRLVKGSSIENFLNFKGFGELVYDTALYKITLAEGFLRFSDFQQNVAVNIESKKNIDYIYGKLFVINDIETENEILEQQIGIYKELFHETPSVECSDVYTRAHLKAFLRVL